MDTPALPPPSGRLPGLDALRGIAALWVLWFHASGIVLERPFPSGKGYLAVDFFFMLSGYVMARTYEHRFAAGYTAPSFLIARYKRLWPVMAIGGLISAPMLAIELNDPARFAFIAFANLLLIPATAGAVIYPLNTAAWSIMAELIANAVHAAGLWRLRQRALLAFAACMVPFLVWICLAYGSLDSGAGIDTWPSGIARALFAYTVGVVLWRAWRDVPPLRISPVAAIAAMPAMLVSVEAFGISGWWFDIAFVLFACPLLIAGGLAFTGDSPLARRLGDISFPLYAINLPIMHWCKGLGIPAAVGIGLALALALYIAARMTPRPRAPEKPGAPPLDRPSPLPGR